MKSHTNEGTYTLILGDELTFDLHDEFREKLFEMEGTTESKIVIDMGNVKYIDSAGLGMLLLANEKAEEKKIKIILKAAFGQVDRMMKLAKFDQIFDFEA